MLNRRILLRCGAALFAALPFLITQSPGPDAPPSRVAPSQPPAADRGVNEEEVEFLPRTGKWISFWNAWKEGPERAHDVMGRHVDEAIAYGADLIILNRVNLASPPIVKFRHFPPETWRQSVLRTQIARFKSGDPRRVVWAYVGAVHDFEDGRFLLDPSIPAHRKLVLEEANRWRAIGVDGLCFDWAAGAEVEERHARKFGLHAENLGKDRREIFKIWKQLLSQIGMTLAIEPMVMENVAGEENLAELWTEPDQLQLCNTRFYRSQKGESWPPRDNLLILVQPGEEWGNPQVSDLVSMRRRGYRLVGGRTEAMDMIRQADRIIAAQRLAPDRAREDGN